MGTGQGRGRELMATSSRNTQSDRDRRPAKQCHDIITITHLFSVASKSVGTRRELMISASLGKQAEPA